MSVRNLKEKFIDSATYVHIGDLMDAGWGSESLLICRIAEASNLLELSLERFAGAISDGA